MNTNNHVLITGNGRHNQTNNHGNGNGHDIATVNSLSELFIPSLAFVLSCPQAKTGKNMLYYNREAFRVLSRISPSLNNEESLSSYANTLNSKWMDLLDKKGGMISESIVGRNYDTNTGADYFDVLKSDRRRYGVRGTIIMPQIPVRKKQDRRYLFIMERICVTYQNLPMLIRMWNLNRREGEIVELLFKGLCNKEMARVLGLSSNTVTMYLKILMNKLGVASRTEIIPTILTKKNKRNSF